MLRPAHGYEFDGHAWRTHPQSISGMHTDASVHPLVIEPRPLRRVRYEHDALGIATQCAVQPRNARETLRQPDAAGRWIATDLEGAGARQGEGSTLPQGMRGRSAGERRESG
jgi:hypothetical protein